MPTHASNKEAFYSYSIDDSLEAGLSLLGHEVKSIKSGQVSLKGAYVTIRNGEAFLRNAHIGKYKHATNLEGYNETRERKLLLHKQEIHKLQNQTHEKGTALIPLELYTKKRNIKLKIGIGRGKKQFDKREALKKKEIKRKLERTIRTRI
ncbi:MAG: SsrA-binding protein SmpB [Candidatus Doudnabacteria bacterium]|nr:SsrA-binding protein SmpB [Candidatus Doudnabacteria bacterium]